MTKEDLNKLRAERDRTIDMLAELNPIREAETVSKVLDNLQILDGFLNPWWLDKTPEAPAAKLEDEPSKEEFSPPVMTVLPKTEPASDPEPTPEPEPAADTGKTYTKEEVRAALAQSRKKGVNVTELLAEFGAANFTGLPAAKYPEVMARLEEL